MSFIDKIEEVQKKPEAIRKRILFITMAVAAFIVIFIWVSTLKFSLSAKESMATDFTPFKIFRDIFKDTISLGASAASGGVKEILDIKDLINKYNK